MKKVRPWCGQLSDRGRLRNRTERNVQHISDMHSKFALRPQHVWNYVRHPISDRRLGEEKSKKKETKKEGNHSCKIECPHLLHRAAITSGQILKVICQKGCMAFARGRFNGISQVAPVCTSN